MTLSPGQQLRQARDERRLSIEQAAQATRIRPHYIQALEADDFSSLPSLAHGRGFLRAYAQYLGLAPEPLLAEVESSSPTVMPLPAETAPAEPDESEAAEIFTEIGRTLRQRREMLGLSVEDIERQVFLRAHYVRALEDGRMESFPSPVQTRGMLGNYAHFLGLDDQAVLLRFADGLQAGLKARQARRAPIKAARRRKGTRWFSWFPTEFFLAFIFVAFLVGFLIWGALRVTELRSATTPEPTAPSVAEVLAGQMTTPSPEATATPGTLTPQATNTQGVLVLEPTQPLEPTATATIPPLNQDPVQVYVAVRQRAWMRVTVDGKVAFEGRVVPGGAYLYSGKQQIEITTGNGAALQVFFNRIDTGTLGILGQVSTRIFTPAGMQMPTATATPIGTLAPTSTTAPTTPTHTPTITPRP